MEYGIKFTITPATGDAVVFNQPDENGNIYIVQEAQGFDSATVRALVQNAPQRAGGLVFPSERGPQYPGLRGLIIATDTETAFKMEQTLRRLHVAMHKSWALATWKNSDGVARQMRLAAQNVGILGSIPKEFLLQWTSDQAQKDGQTAHTHDIASGATEVLENVGDVDAYARVIMYGGFSHYVCTNEKTGVTLDIAGSVADGDWLDIDMLRDTIYLNSDVTLPVPDMLTNIADFWALVPGPQSVYGSATDASGVPGPSLHFEWRDGWA